MADVLGSFEQAVLIAVVRLQADAYGRAILKEVQARLDRDVAPGAVHATLGRLEQKKLLSSKLGPGTPVRAGRAPLPSAAAFRRERVERRACRSRPALHRLEQAGLIHAAWRISETSRRARFYQLTSVGRRELKSEEKNWDALTAAVARVLQFT